MEGVSAIVLAAGVALLAVGLPFFIELPVALVAGGLVLTLLRRGTVRSERALVLIALVVLAAIVLESAVLALSTSG